MFNTCRWFISAACLLTLCALVYGQTQVPVNALYQEGVAFYEAGKYRKALKVWEQMLTNRFNDLTRKQRMALRTRIAAANRMVKLSPVANTPQALAEAAMDNAKERFNKAVTQLRSTAERDFAKGTFNEAVNFLVEAEKQGSHDPKLDHMMAYACLHTDRLSQGWIYLDRTIKNNPYDPKPLNLKADYLKARGGKALDRIAILKRSLQLDPNQREVHIQMCRAYLSTRQRQYLKPAYEHAVKGAGKDPEMARKLAKLFPAAHYKNQLDALAAKLAVAAAEANLPTQPSWKQNPFGKGRVSSTLIRVP